jgi:hypothetical protein
VRDANEYHFFPRDPGSMLMYTSNAVMAPEGRGGGAYGYTWRSCKCPSHPILTRRGRIYARKRKARGLASLDPRLGEVHGRVWILTTGAHHVVKMLQVLLPSHASLAANQPMCRLLLLPPRMLLWIGTKLSLQ